MREIPQRELRNNVSAVLREVEAGRSLRVTVRGRPVADLVPVVARKRGLTPEEVSRIFAEAPLDAGFSDDLDAVAGATVDDALIATRARTVSRDMLVDTDDTWAD